MTDLIPIIQAVVYAAAFVGAVKLLTDALTSTLAEQREARRKLFQNAVDEVVELRKALVERLDHRPLEGLGEAVTGWLEAVTEQVRGGRPPDEEVEPMPEVLVRWINQWADEWARDQLRRRAHELYTELQDWQTAAQILTQEGGYGEE